VMVLSHRLWQRRFAADPGIAGKSVLLSGRPFTVVGVAPLRLALGATRRRLVRQVRRRSVRRHPHPVDPLVALREE
jgi:hypothetical protein